MKKIKGAKKLNRTLSNFAKQFDCKVFLDTDFYCNPLQNKVYYALAVTGKDSTSFMDRVRRLYPDINADEFLWSLLHEIGHIETVDDLSDEESFEIYTAKNAPNISNEDYYELPDEYLATDWAANYMRENQEQVAKLWKKIRQNIMHIYKVNHLF